MTNPDPTNNTQVLQTTLLNDSDTPIPNIPINLTINGTNALSLTSHTDANDVATFTYSSTDPGNNTTQTTFTAYLSTPVVQSKTSTVEWIQLDGTNLTLTQPALTPTGTPVTLSATLTSDNTNQPVPNTTISFTITNVNPTTATATTNNSGITTFTYTGTHKNLDMTQTSITIAETQVASPQINIH